MIYSLATHVAEKCREAGATTESFHDHSDLEAWKLWSARWKVESHRPTRTSVDEGYKIGNTLMFLLRSDGMLAYIEFEKKWDSGVLTYPTRKRIREAGWHYLGGSTSALTNDSEISRIWDYMQTKVKVRTDSKTKYAKTSCYPLGIDNFRDGRQLIKSALFRKLNSLKPQPTRGK